MVNNILNKPTILFSKNFKDFSNAFKTFKSLTVEPVLYMYIWVFAKYLVNAKMHDSIRYCT